MHDPKEKPRSDQDRGQQQDPFEGEGIMSNTNIIAPSADTRWSACPEWCVRIPGDFHIPDVLVLTGEPVMLHDATVVETDELRIIRVMEQRLTPAGLVVREFFTVFGEEEWEITSERARALSAALAEAADRMDAQEGGA